MPEPRAAFVWLTTAPRPQSSARGFDAGQRGWRTHAVAAADHETFSSVGRRKAACGLAPRHGWGMDLFIEDRCSRCQRALSEAAPAPNA